MNTSKSNFLDRFNGKIGFVTKHGELITRSSFDGVPCKKLLTEDSTGLNCSKIYKGQLEMPFRKDHQK